MKKTNNCPSGEQSRLERVSVKGCVKARKGEEKCEVIKLGIDVHAVKLVVARMRDAQNPQPAQSFTMEEFLNWVQKQLTLAREVHAVYEAGPFGYVLYRKLLAMGVKAQVIQPQLWDERKRSRKTDKLDAREMALRLDRYVAGNPRALNLVRVPSEEEEIQRAESRARNVLLKQHTRMEATGRSLLLTLGIRLTAGRWWHPAQMKLLEGQVDTRVLKVLRNYRAVLQAVRQQLLEATLELRAKSAQRTLPVGMGALSDQQIDREICDWDRFQKPRQVSSYTGLCPGEHSTGEKHRQGRISKTGNTLLRMILIEMAWRLIRYQPDYGPVKWFGEVVVKRGPSYRKKAITAVARRLAVDLWKIKTGRKTADELNLRLASGIPRLPKSGKKERKEENQDN
jgi:transposase